MITLLGNRYRVVREIGAGGMGRVFQAVDTKTGTAVAAKVMIADRDESLQSLLRFYQEGAVLSTLRHPNIVLVHGTFLEEGACSIIMELLEGYSLADLLSKERLDLDRVAHIGGQTASALAFAHGRGIIHRDVKPSNIMVVGADHVKVTDFGIARVAEGNTLHTATGMSLGTPLYMSPEQIEGGTVDARSDIYSLGAVIFEMLAGRPPFEGHDPLSVAFKHVHTSPPLPSSLNADVPPPWEQLVLQMLAKDPAKRVQTADDVADALAALQQPGGVSRSSFVTLGTDSVVDSYQTTHISAPVPGPAVEDTTLRPVARAASESPATDTSVAVLEPPKLPAHAKPNSRGRTLALLGGAFVVVVVAALVARALLGGHSGTTGGVRYTFLRELGFFNNPEGVTVDPAGNVWVAVWGDNKIQELSPGGTLVRSWGSKGSGPRQLDGPTGVAIGRHNSILVADSHNNRIQKFLPAGRWRASWGGPEAGSGAGQFSGVHGLAVDSRGIVYAADYNNNRIVKLSPRGNVLAMWGQPSGGSGTGQFKQPLDVAVDGSGAIYVADFDNSRIQKLSSDGRFLRIFAGLGSPTGFVRPHGVAVDSHGNIFVADYQNHVVEEITASGHPVQLIGKSGRSALKQPVAVTVDAQGRLYVADAGANRVMVYTPAG